MDFDLVGDPADVETIATGRGIRELPRLRRLYGTGRWEEDERQRSNPAQRWPHSAG
jgi:hypothetical protein